MKSSNRNGIKRPSKSKIFTVHPFGEKKIAHVLFITFVYKELDVIVYFIINVLSRINEKQKSKERRSRLAGEQAVSDLLTEESVVEVTVFLLT